jgi:tetratricopeptide (TPR) repeat protein
MNKKSLVIFLSSLFLHTILHAQEWTLKLRSSVELRTFKLTNKVDISEEKLAGATITLSKGATTISQMQSDGSGDFVIDVPANGDYILTISYSGCNPKKFAISTMNVPEELAKDNYKPTFGIEGVIMAKAFPSINYSVLQQPLARIVYTPNGKKFDDEEGYTNQMLAELTKIREAENVLMNNFTSTNNTGDVALSKGDCPLAKASYEKAMTIIPGERYPSEQLPKVGDCLKQKELADKKAADEAKLAAEKLEAEKLAKEKAAQEKLEADKLAKDKVAQEAANKAAQAEAEKAQKAKLAAEKAETERLAKEKAAQEKLETDKLAKDKIAQEAAAKATKVESEKVQKDKLAKEKLEADKIAKEASTKAAKEAAEKAAQSKVTKTKETPKEPVKEKTTTPAKETTGAIVPNSTSSSESGSAGVGSGDAKYSIPQALGADKYKATIKRADELFKMKRYSEAKPMYEEALKQKPNDPAATNKLTEIEKLTIKK